MELELGASFINIDRKRVTITIIAPKMSPPKSHFSRFTLVIINEVRKTDKYSPIYPSIGIFAVGF